MTITKVDDQWKFSVYKLTPQDRIYGEGNTSRIFKVIEMQRTLIIMFLFLLVAKKEILQIMNKTISKPRASRKENGPIVGNTLKLLTW